MHSPTGDETADYLLKQLRFIRRHGTPAMREAAPKWALIVQTHAEPPAQESTQAAVNFAQATQPAEAGQ